MINTILECINKDDFLYSLNAEILNKLYQSTMLGDKTIGLGDIECYKNKEFKIAELINYSVLNS